MVHRNWRFRNLTTLAMAVLLITAIGCGKKKAADEVAPAPPPETPAPAPTPAAAVAVAELQGQEGSGISGKVTFTQNGDSVTVTAEVAGLTGSGEHGLHVHEVGECSGDFTSAGDHFNPAGHPHGGPGQPESHAGDLGNITIGEDGTGTLTLTSNALSVDPGPNSVVGRAVVLHEKADDLESQPTGAAGGRAACGVVVAQEAGGGGY
jgi:superoxide dismutase, Cu-Zn family